MTGDSHWVSGFAHPGQERASADIAEAKATRDFHAQLPRTVVKIVVCLSMSSQILEYAETEDRSLNSVMQYVKPDQTGVEISIRGNITLIDCRFRHQV